MNAISPTDFISFGIELQKQKRIKNLHIIVIFNPSSGMDRIQTLPKYFLKTILNQSSVTFTEKGFQAILF